MSDLRRFIRRHPYATVFIASTLFAAPVVTLLVLAEVIPFGLGLAGAISMVVETEIMEFSLSLLTTSLLAPLSGYFMTMVASLLPNNKYFFEGYKRQVVQAVETRDALVDLIATENKVAESPKPATVQQRRMFQALSTKNKPGKRSGRPLPPIPTKTLKHVMSTSKNNYCDAPRLDLRDSTETTAIPKPLQGHLAGLAEGLMRLKTVAVEDKHYCDEGLQEAPRKVRPSDELGGALFDALTMRRNALKESVFGANESMDGLTISPVAPVAADTVKQQDEHPLASVQQGEPRGVNVGQVIFNVMQNRGFKRDESPKVDSMHRDSLEAEWALSPMA